MKKLLKIMAGLVFLAGICVAGYLGLAPHAPDMVFSTATVPVPKADGIEAHPERNAYFGDLHLHTTYSMDANVFGNKIDPRGAYRFAKGETMEVGMTGMTKKLTVPLDFAAVTDHAEGLGMVSQCYQPGSGTYWSLQCVGTRYKILLVFPSLFNSNVQHGDVHAHYPAGACAEDGHLCVAASKTVWEDIKRAANENYEPGKFTTLLGFEYSPTLIDGGMVHRNVIFRNEHAPDSVFSAADGFAEDLLRWLDQRCTGDCQALSIPHNSNFSWGLMFGDRNANASPVTRDNLLLRAKYERLVEIFQAKGSSECTPGVGNNDEQCGFENLFPACTEEQSAISDQRGIHTPRCVVANDMVRNVLRRGLLLDKQMGFNPFQFGIIGSTDNHNSLMGDTEEKGYVGHAAPNDSTVELRLGMESTIVSKTLGFPMQNLNPGGLAAVWAERNTREAIWDALQRREAWGTSGTRVKVRFFGGFNLPERLQDEGDAITRAYQLGVPMGGTLTPTDDQAPSFLVMAQQDIHSAPLQRLQIVKGWVNGDNTQERVYDIACSDGLTPDATTHRCPDNGAKVNLQDCSISADKGDAQLATTWTDPDFHADQSAFYYVRVLENPVCRYTQYDALKLGKPHPSNVSPTIQERAWSSPIWVHPKT